MLFMTVRFRSGSTSPVTPGVQVFKQQQLMTGSYWLFVRKTSFRVPLGSWICNSDYFYYTLLICIQVFMCLCAILWAQGVGWVCIRRSEDAQRQLLGVYCAFKVRPLSCIFFVKSWPRLTMFLRLLSHLEKYFQLYFYRQL